MKLFSYNVHLFVCCMWYTVYIKKSVPFFSLSGWSGDWEFLCHVPKQRTVAPPSARMSQYAHTKHAVSVIQPWDFKMFDLTSENIQKIDMSLFCSSAVIDCGEPKALLNGGVTFLSGFQNQYRSVVQYRCNEPFYSLLGGVNGEIFICIKSSLMYSFRFFLPFLAAIGFE